MEIFIFRYELLKIVRYFGDIEKFDLPTYRRGVNAGKSRRYAFVTYKYEKDATTAKRMLHNTKLHNRLISVCYSHAIEKVRWFVDELFIHYYNNYLYLFFHLKL